ncbi:hypothetical protein HWV62_23194 [Athelia sp. TMB]|nr:hypothetical protein HWV62_23194 [Athelia sp. TMB]
MLSSLLSFSLVFIPFQSIYSLAVNTSVLCTHVTSGISAATNLTATNPAGACDNLNTCRSLYAIVQTCLATIFACVWVAVHRNIPAPKPKPKYSSNRVKKAAQWLWAKILDQRQSVIVFTVTLLAPEWVLAWAIRQALRARKLARELEEARMDAMKRWEEDHPEYVKEQGADTAEDAENRSTEISLRSLSEDELPLIKKRSISSRLSTSPAIHPEDQIEWMRASGLAQLDQSWTIAHAFFIIMGGYHGYNKHGPLYPLGPDAVVSLVRDGKLVPPSTEELSDRSKGDALSKIVAILQTFWFVVQCIARLAEHLPITNLEVMTLAYTVMTLAMYIAWWYKPLNVTCAIRAPAGPRPEARGILSKFNVWDRIGHYVMGRQDDLVDLCYLQRVPTFWAGQPNVVDVSHADYVALPVATTFGAVHCIAWSYAFASHTELLLWRASAITILVVPGGIILAMILIPSKRRGLEYLGIFLFVIFFYIGALLYIFARVVLLMFSFTTLASLAPAIYKTVQWAEFIPHI